jgi:hypothetical protein
MFQDYKTATDSKDESRFNHIIWSLTILLRATNILQ